MKIVSRRDAIRLGLKFYFTGKPCKNGNIAERSVACHCRCKECKIVFANRVLLWGRENSSKLLARARKWREENRAKISSYQLKNRNQHKVTSKLWRKNNRASIYARNHKREAGKRNAKPSWFSDWDTFVIEEAADLCSRRKQATGVDWSIDHIFPLQSKDVCGLHISENIQVIPAVTNSAKGNRLANTKAFGFQ